MSQLQVLAGEFRPQSARIRYSDAGRPYLRLISTDGVTDEIYLKTDLAECFTRPQARDIHLPLFVEAEMAADDSRAERQFAVVLADGRSFVASARAELLAELRSYCRQVTDAEDLPSPPPAARPGLFARLFGT